MKKLGNKKKLNQNRIIWFKGELIRAEYAKVQILSPTAQFGLNVFEGIRGYWSERHQDLFLFRLNEHLKRLYESCKILGIKSPYDFNYITKAIIETLHANEYRCDISIRVTLFVDQEGGWSSCDPVEMFVAAIDKPRSDLDFLNGKSGMISSYERINDRSMPPRAKAGANYINSRYAYLESQSLNYDYPILLDRVGNISESSGACLMMLKDNILITPPITASIVESITGDTLLKLSEEINQKTDIRNIDKDELYLADEIFLCGSSAEIIPLISIDNKLIGNGTVGIFTKKIYKEYLNAVTGSHPNWLTSVFNNLKS
jgi:branched-chain amino acid aminotransferase